MDEIKTYYKYKYTLGDKEIVVTEYENYDESAINFIDLKGTK